MRRIIAVLTVVVLFLGASCACAEEPEWVCPGCGALNTTNFCVKCGTGKPEEQVCPGCGKACPADAGFAFCGDCGTRLQGELPAASMRYEGDGFDTPEEAVLNYVAGLRDLDLAKILRSFAIETLAEKETLKNKLMRITAYNPMLLPQFPDDNGLLRAVNAELMKNDIVTRLSRSLFIYLHPDQEETLGMSVPLTDEAAVDAFIAGYDLSALEAFRSIDLDKVEFVDPDLLTEGKYSAEFNQNTLERLRVVYGADEITDRAAVFTVGDEQYIVMPGLVKYGDRWFICSLQGNLSMILGIDTYRSGFCSTSPLRDGN